jgi:hypothetical protein
MSDTTRLAISGVPSRVALRVTERHATRATLEQKLPFLTIGTEVADEEGRTGRIARVNVALEGGVPKLVLELAYDAVPLRASSPPGARVRRDETMSYERASAERVTVPPPTRALRIEVADRSLPLAPGPKHAAALAFPLENRRNPSAQTRSWLAWLLSPFTGATSRRD